MPDFPAERRDLLGLPRRFRPQPVVDGGNVKLGPRARRPVGGQQHQRRAVAPAGNGKAHARAVARHIRDLQGVRERRPRCQEQDIPLRTDTACALAADCG